MTHVLAMERKFLNTSNGREDFIHYNDVEGFLSSDKLYFVSPDSKAHHAVTLVVTYVEVNSKSCFCTDEGLERSIVKTLDIRSGLFTADNNVTSDILFVALKHMLEQDHKSELDQKTLDTIRRRIDTHDFGIFHDKTGTDNIYLMFCFEMPEVIELSPHVKSIAGIRHDQLTKTRQLDRVSQIAIQPILHRFGYVSD